MTNEHFAYMLDGECHIRVVGERHLVFIDATSTVRNRTGQISSPCSSGIGRRAPINSTRKLCKRKGCYRRLRVSYLGELPEETSPASSKRFNLIKQSAILS